MGTFRIGQRGFTLAEIVVAVGIVAILATVAIGSFSEMRKKAHDTQRKSDIEQIQLALRMYKNTNGSYPLHPTEMVIGEGGALDTELASYFPSVPKDPLGSVSDTTYEYVYDSNFDCGTQIGLKVLYAKQVERTSSANWATVCGSGPGEAYGVILR